MYKSHEKIVTDPEMLEFMVSLEQSIQEAQSGQYAVVHTPEQIQARKRGRPLGSNQVVTKKRVTITLDPDVLAALRATGKGWQTRLNDMVRAQVIV